MHRILASFAVASVISSAQVAFAQPAPEAAALVEAKKEVVVNWTLSGQAWDFKAVLGTYEPVKGSLDTARNEARWTFQLVKDLEAGAATLHNQTKGTPFRMVLLNADKLIMGSDAKVEMTESSGKSGDRIEVYFQLPEREILDKVKFIRIERRTNVGF